ncbi:NAD-dependent succinate-semialdehyde dehydrogenase [Kineococcus glutinatus]|uniref:NAD-dependent succinate-semialdehyde dehydrogenase n=1 Tax=Kineococcus glutinatus TaxID=1070872 RepID=UPI0031E88FF8
MAGDAAARVLAAVPHGLLVGGTWRPATGRATFDVRDPATGGVLAQVADGTAADALAALDAAVDAAAGWAATPPRRRSEVLRRAFDLLLAREEEFALLMTLEMGKPLAEARGEVRYGAEFLRWFSEEAVRIPGRYGTNPEGTGTVVVTRRPVGPCLLITPWNFPLAMATRKIAPALAAGCTAVVKPAELTPLTTLLFAQLLAEAGLPAGVVNVVTTTRSPEVCAPVIADPRLRKLSFTGSTAVGRALLGQAADGVLRTSMELGGNAPFVVFDDADLDAAVAGALQAKFRNTGQACTAGNRFVVHADVADEFARRLTEAVRAMPVGPGTAPGTVIGPLIDDRAVASAAALVADAVAQGAQLLTGGSAPQGPGCFFEPTVLAGVPTGARVWREEIFGPVLAVTTFTDEAEAVRLADDTEYGLASYVYTRDLDRAHRMIAALDSGMTGVNTGVVSNAAAPFGGTKGSGLGREGGSEGIEEYLETKYALIATGPAR